MVFKLKRTYYLSLRSLKLLEKLSKALKEPYSKVLELALEELAKKHLVVVVGERCKHFLKFLDENHALCVLNGKIKIEKCLKCERW